MTAGVKYALVFNVGANAAAWGTRENYANGQALMWLGSDGWWVVVPDRDWDIGDYAFRTYVATESSASPSSEASSAAPSAEASSAAPSAAASSAAPSAAASSPATITPPPTTSGGRDRPNGSGVPMVTFLALVMLATAAIMTVATARNKPR